MTIGEAQKMEAAIHRHCLMCSGGSRKEVENCSLKSCALYPYRQPDSARSPQKPAAQLSMLDMGVE